MHAGDVGAIELAVETVLMRGVHRVAMAACSEAHAAADALLLDLCWCLVEGRCRVCTTLGTSRIKKQACAYIGSMLLFYGLSGCN